MSIRCAWVDSDGIRCPGVGIESRSTRGGKRYCRAHADCHSAHGGMLIIDAMVVDSVAGAILTERERRTVINRVAARKAGRAVNVYEAATIIAKRDMLDQASAVSLYETRMTTLLGLGRDEHEAHAAALYAVFKAGRDEATRMPVVKPTGADRRAGLEVED